MVILKVNAEEDKVQQVEIVSERGVWGNGVYKIFNAIFLDKATSKDIANEPSDENDPNFLGKININKEKEDWVYKGRKLSHSVQKQIADFIFDYKAPDAVY
jgi:hypothetical protein